MKLYASGYGNEISRMRTQGFEDPDPPTYQQEKAPPPGIRLQYVEPQRDWMTEAFKIDFRYKRARMTAALQRARRHRSR